MQRATLPELTRICHTLRAPALTCFCFNTLSNVLLLDFLSPKLNLNHTQIFHSAFHNYAYFRRGGKKKQKKKRFICRYESFRQYLHCSCINYLWLRATNSKWQTTTEACRQIKLIDSIYWVNNKRHDITLSLWRLLILPRNRTGDQSHINRIHTPIHDCGWFVN